MPRGRSNNPRAPSPAATAAREPASSSAAAATAADAARAARGRIAPQFSVLSATKDLSAALSVLKSTSSSVSSSSATTAAAHSSPSSSSALDDPEAACSGSNSMDMDEGQADGAAGAEATAFVDAAPLLALLEAHHDKNEALDLRELLELMSQFDVQALWREAASAVHNIASKRAYLVDEINVNEDDEINMSLAESLMAEDALKEKRQRASAAAKAAHDALFGVSSLVLLAVQPRSRSDEDAAASRPPCEALFETLRSLHGLLFDLALCDGEAIAVIVARCCERWWVSEWSNREELVTQLLPYLLATAMADNAKQADVKRIHGVRHALELLDFDDPSAETIRGLLLRGMSAGAFLKKKPTRKSRSKSKNKKSKRKKQNKKMNKGKTRATAEEPEEDSVASDASDNDEIALKADASSEDDGEDGENIDRLFSSDGASMSSSLALSEGQRVLAFSFGLNASLAADMYAALKSHLPHATPAQHTSHGVVLFRAWKNSLTSGAAKTRSVLEEQCVQDLMATAIKVASRTLFSACRRILQAFTSQKRRDGVDEMLFRLYNPIIWRGLSAAHPEVRRQAAVLFIDAFPLQDPAAPNVETDALLLKQFSELQRLLEDQVPSVRSVAIEGASRILAEYWDLIPVRFAKKMLTTMVDRLARDASSTGVRVAVIEGLDHLIGHCTDSHAAMKVVLPRLQMMLHDRSARVRRVFVRLLVGIRDIKTIAVADVVPVSHLHARLVADADIDNISSLLVRLLLPTYYPQSSRSAVQLERASTLLLSSPASALVFFRRLHSVLSVQKVCKLVLLFRRLTNSLASRLDDDAFDDDADDASGVEEGDDADAFHVGGRSKKRARDTNNRLRRSLGADGGSLDGPESASSSPSPSASSDTLGITEAQEQLLSDIRLILVGMRILWSSVHSELQLPHYAPALQLMQDEFSSVADYGTNSKPDDESSSSTFFHMLLRVPLLHGDAPCRAEIFALCGMLPHDTVGELRERLLPRILQLKSNSNIAFHERECLVQTLCRWGVGPQLVALATQSVRSAFGKNSVGTSKQKKMKTSLVMGSATSKGKRKADERCVADETLEEFGEEGEDDEEEDDDPMTMTLATAVHVLELTVAGNVGGIRDQILSNAQWSKRLIEAAYLARPALEKRLLSPRKAAKSDISDDSLIRSFRLFCKLLVHGAAADEDRARKGHAKSLGEAADAARRKKGRKSSKDKAAIATFEAANLTGDVLGYPAPQFPRELLRTISWTTKIVFRRKMGVQHLRGGEENDGDSSDDEYAFAGRSALKGGLMDLISSPVPLPPSRHRRRAYLGSGSATSPGSPSSSSGDSDRGARIEARGFSKLACKVAVLVTGVVADCAAMGFRDCTESGTFVRRNVAEWEEAAVEMSVSLSDWRESGAENTEMERALTRNMRRLSNWRKNIAKRKKKEKGGGGTMSNKAVSISVNESSSLSLSSSPMSSSLSSRGSLGKENGMSPSQARGGVGEKSRHLRKDGSAYLARKILKKKKRPNTPVSGGFSGRSPLSANSNNGASSYSHSTGSANSLRRRKLKQEEDEADLSKMLDDSVISSNGAFTPSKANAVGSSVYDYRSASKAAYDKLLRLVDSDDEEEEDMFA